MRASSRRISSISNDRVSRSNHTKATCALANKLARICFAALRDQAPFASERLHRKLTRQAYPMPA